MKVRVELEKEEIDAIAILANIKCPCKKEESFSACKFCPLFVTKGLIYNCLHQVAKQVYLNNNLFAIADEHLKRKCELNSMYGKLVTAYADTDSTGEQKRCSE